MKRSVFVVCSISLAFGFRIIRVSQIDVIVLIGEVILFKIGREGSDLLADW